MGKKQAEPTWKVVPLGAESRKRPAKLASPCLKSILDFYSLAKYDFSSKHDISCPCCVGLLLVSVVEPL